MSARRNTAAQSRRDKAPQATAETALRIIGGRFGGRKLKYSGDPRVRPMKERVRETLFNLIGPAIRGHHAIDLFAGTGVLALEALSRGATGATAVERHFPSARVIRENVSALNVSEVVEVVTADTFWWLRQTPELPAKPWAVFCSPPYRFYDERREDMLWLVGELLRRAPEQSLFALEATEQFDFGLLPSADRWDVRSYPPAVLGIYVSSSSIRGGTPDGSPTSQS